MTIKDRIIKALGGKSTLSTPENWLVEVLRGETISKDTALEVSACYACVKLLSNQIAVLPLNLYKKQERGRTKESDNPIHKLLNIEPNPYMTAYQFWNVIMFNLVLGGAGYAEIERDKKTKAPIALWPIPFSNVKKSKTIKGEPVYEITIKEPGKEIVRREIRFGNMLEIQGFSHDGYGTYEPVSLLKRTLGLARSAEEYSREYFDEGTHPSGIITYENALKPDRHAEFKAQIKQAYSGLGKHHRVLLMESGMQFQKISAPPNEGQMFESRKFQVIEICRFFNVPPHKVMELDRATWSNIEEMNTSFVNDSLMPYCKNIEQAVYQSLLFGFQKDDGYYCEFDLNSLLRGKTTERFAAYAQARQWGWLCVNEIRAKENLPDIGPQGDRYIEPMNMQEAGKGGSK